MVKWTLWVVLCLSVEGRLPPMREGGLMRTPCPNGGFMDDNGRCRPVAWNNDEGIWRGGTIRYEELINLFSGGRRYDEYSPRERGRHRPASTRDFHPRGRDELRDNPWLSTPEECARTCRVGEPPKTCYYHFTLELYNVLGKACEVCTPNATNTITSTCQCVIADGVERSFLAVNRQLPGPGIEVCKGDKIYVDVMNMMDGIETTVHWHGVSQRGTQYYDGMPYVTQCPIHAGNSFRYHWTSDDAGTLFYHAHSGLQKLDGIHGSLIVREPQREDPNGHLYDYDLSEHVVELSDWMHEYAMERFPGRLIYKPGQTPDSILINGKGQYEGPDTPKRTDAPIETFYVNPGSRYRFRVITSMATICPVQLNVQGHRLTIIAVDGKPIRPVDVDTVVSFSGERYDFVINANQRYGAFWIQVRGLGECGIQRVQQVAILRYTRGNLYPLAPRPTYDNGLPLGVVLNPFDGNCERPRKDAICINQLKSATPVDKRLLKKTPDLKLYLPFRFFEYTPEQLFKPNHYNKYLQPASGSPLISLVDGISYKSAPSPPISQLHDIPPGTFCNRDYKPAHCGANCTCTHMIQIPLNAVVEVVVIDEAHQTNLSHPFHLHGYSYRVIGMGQAPGTRDITPMTVELAVQMDEQRLISRNFDRPPAKDTVAVPNNGFFVMRFIADNPGYWFFHCHFLYHIVIGMGVIFNVGSQSDLPPVPPDFPTCGSFLPPISRR